MDPNTGMAVPPTVLGVLGLAGTQTESQDTGVDLGALPSLQPIEGYEWQGANEQADSGSDSSQEEDEGGPPSPKYDESYFFVPKRPSTTPGTRLKRRRRRPGGACPTSAGFGSGAESHRPAGDATGGSAFSGQGSGSDAQGADEGPVFECEARNGEQWRPREEGEEGGSDSFLILRKEMKAVEGGGTEGAGGTKEREGGGRMFCLPASKRMRRCLIAGGEGAGELRDPPASLSQGTSATPGWSLGRKRRSVSQITPPGSRKSRTPLSQAGFRGSSPAEDGGGSGVAGVTVCSIEVLASTTGARLPDPRKDAILAIALAAVEDPSNVSPVVRLLLLDERSAEASPPLSSLSSSGVPRRFPPLPVPRSTDSASQPTSPAALAPPRRLFQPWPSVGPFCRRLSRSAILLQAVSLHGRSSDPLRRSHSRRQQEGGIAAPAGI